MTLRFEQGSYTLYSYNVTQRQVVGEVFTAIGAEVIWPTHLQADEHIAGPHVVSLEVIANNLLLNLYLTVVYDMTGENLE